MASSTSSVQEETQEKTPEAPAKSPQKSNQPKRSWGRLLFGLLALALLTGLGALAALSTTQSSETASQVSATPAASPGATATARTSVTGSATTAQVLADPLIARPVLRDIAAYPGDFQLLFAATADGLRRSGDGGKTWADVADFKGRNITGLAFDGDDGERPAYVATDRMGLFKSTDGGKTWKNIGLAGRPIGALAVARRNVYVYVSGPQPSIYRSADGGQNWFAPSSNNLPANLEVRVIAVDNANPQSVFIGTAHVPGGRTPDWGRVKYSSDSGKTWRDLGIWGPEKGDGPDPLRPVTVLVYATGDRIYAGDSENLWRLSPDRTAWQPVTSGLPTSGVYAIANDRQITGLVYAATRDGFYRNSDGQTWQKLATGETGPVFGNASNPTPLSVFPALVAATTGNAANSISGLRSTYLYGLSAEGLLTRYENRDFGSEIVAQVPGASNLPNFTAFGGTNPADRLPPPAEGTNDPTKFYVQGWGHYVQGKFREVWQRKDIPNALELYGYPLTEQFRELDVRDKKTKTVQFFERVKFEMTDEPNAQVRLSLIGYESIADRFFAPGRFIPTNAGQQFFNETQHTLKGEFFKFWKANGELQRFGFPISEEFSEKTPDGREVVYQYFERAKFAFDPQNKQVTVALLGREVLEKRGWLK